MDSTVEEQKKLPDGAEERLRRGRDFRYGHLAATQMSSKQTATQRKGRIKDQEASEQAPEPKDIIRSWRKPSFLGSAAGGKEYGSAIHAAMQYIRYENCGSEAEIRQEVARLVQQKFLTPEQGELVNCQMIARFFESDMGKKLCQGVPCIREFKFSILDDGSHYGDGLEGEQVLLQGVVDCALLEEDGITVLDFKSDYVTEDTLPTLVERYRPQVETYVHALGRIYQKKVKDAYLYFFRLNRFVKV